MFDIPLNGETSAANVALFLIIEEIGHDLFGRSA
jgi:hypothetical protein